MRPVPELQAAQAALAEAQEARERGRPGRAQADPEALAKLATMKPVVEAAIAGIEQATEETRGLAKRASAMRATTKRRA
jgi:hypothetical protein